MVVSHHKKAFDAVCPKRSEKCVRDIEAWMAINKLKLNKDKTELVVLNAHHCTSPPLESVTVSNEVIFPSSSARNSEVLFNSIYEYRATRSSAFYHLRNINCIRKYISFHIAEILMHAFITSRLCGIPQNILKRPLSAQKLAP